jgi:hypothetical protein
MDTRPGARDVKPNAVKRNGRGRGILGLFREWIFTEQEAVKTYKCFQDSF